MIVCYNLLAPTLIYNNYDYLSLPLSPSPSPPPLLVQQASYYGLAGMLPPRYTQALMLGESVAGLIVSVLRIITKASTNSERKGAIAFFSLGLAYILFCVGCQVFIFKSKFVNFYIKQKAASKAASTDKSKGEEDDPTISMIAYEDLKSEETKTPINDEPYNESDSSRRLGFQQIVKQIQG